MVTFRNESCFDLLSRQESNSVDLVLIDPPYLISRDSGFKSGNNPDYDRLKIDIDFGKWDHRLDGFDQVIHECSGFCVRVAHSFVFMTSGRLQS